MTPQPPPGQGPIDPRGAFAPPPPPGAPQQTPGGFVPPPMGFGPGGMQLPMVPPGMLPPGMMPTPGGYPPPGWFPPPRQPRSIGRALVTTFATTIFGISLMLNVYLLILSGIMGDHTARSTNTVVQGDPKQVVAVVPVITNLITKDDADTLDKQLKEVEGNDNVKAVVLRIDTPGGEVSPSDQMYQRLLQFKSKRPGVKVVISMGGLATSGGYFIACGGDWLIAEPTTLTANIGVLQDSLNFSKLADKWGIEDTTLHNTGADYKSTGSPWREPTDDEKQYMTRLLDAMADRFHDVVKAGRKGRLTAPLAQVFNAQAYPAQTAKDMGIIDQVGYLTDACDYAAKQAQLSNPTILKFEEPSLLQKLFSAQSRLPSPQAGKGVKINGVDIDAPQLDRILNPRPMYLWRGH